MTGSRIEALQAMLEKNPGDSRILFALAMEYEKLERWEDAVSILREYLETADDEGNAWGRLGKALDTLGHREEAVHAYTRGIEAANRHGHPSMAAEFENAVADLSEQ